ncbi:MAG: NAD(P)(+) transhydrogenase (Re/Si-specific) subunit alpha, partial [Candidatus Poseidoniales archaeon]
MRLGVLLEPEGENRVAIVPNSVSKLGKAGFEIIVESGAGECSNYSDTQYVSKGAKVGTREEAMAADILVTIHMPDASDMRSGQIVACVADPFRHPDRVRQCMDNGITLLSMDMIPRRLSRAQSMDVNSSQDNLAGYKAVLMGADNISKAIPMMTTSAGTVKPAKFVIMGSGVAGLQA